jgi:agmatine deiminase
VQLLVKDDETEEQARALTRDSGNVEYVKANYGDCWVRDTAPLFGHTERGALAGLCFAFNGWGGKYMMPFDDSVSAWMTNRLGARRVDCPVVLEGGALEPNGEGTFITTASCVLNENRNPSLTRQSFEEALRAALPVKRLVWLERGLEHDHTDGHVDMVARFVASGTVLCMRADPRAPNAEVLESIERRLRASGLVVLTLPAPSAVFAPDGSALPASYCNFYIANEAVIVPTYGIPQDQAALREIANAFPGREVIGLPARDLLWGGGAFHCVTQPQPAAP